MAYKKTKKDNGKRPKGHSMAIEKMDGTSMNPQQEILDFLRRRTPEVFVEGKIDPAKLAATLGQEVSGDKERYGLSWAGKGECFRHIQEPTTATLRPVRKESAEFDTTGNLFIEGDNLQVLKVLQKSYYGKIKMIYIDPPYNTGSDSFIYPDKFSETQDDYLKRIGDKDAEGNLIRDGFWRKNSKDAGHFHSNWLSMMYPRLFLARNLLRQDGVIFVSIDDNEAHNLRMIMNEVFGEENFVCQFIWNTEGHTDNQYHIKVNHEYVLLYIKSVSSIDDAVGYVVDPNIRPESNLWKGFAENSITKNGQGNPASEVILPKGFPCKTKFTNTIEPTQVSHKFYEEVNVLGYISREITKKYSLEYPVRKTQMKIKNGVLQADCVVYSGWANVNKLKQFIANKFNPLQEEDGSCVFYLSENGVVYYRKERTKARNILSVLRKMGTTEQMRSSLERDGILFQYPKPYELIRYILQFGCNENDIILDFFAGSCTTAHAVMQLNAEDGGNRRYICVQLPEPCDKDSEAAKAGFGTIADIGKERIRRAAKKIKKETDDFIKSHEANPKLFEDADLSSKISNLKSMDLGFKVFKLDESNFKEWRRTVKTAEELKKQMELFVNNVKDGADSEAILYELILKSGLDLNVSVEAKKAGGKMYYQLAGGKLILCLEEKITQGLVDKILAEKPDKFVCLDRAFAGNDQLKTNTALQMEADKVEFKVI